MKIMVENRHIKRVTLMLETMPLVGGESRARTRLVSMLKKAQEQLQSDEKALVNDFVRRDEHGQPVREGESILLKDGRTAGEYQAAHDALMEERAEVSGGTFEGHRQTLMNALTEWDKPLSGDEAETYDILLIALEEGED